MGFPLKTLPLTNYVQKKDTFPLIALSPCVFNFICDNTFY